MNYATKNWQPLGLGMIAGFLLRELLIVAIAAGLIFVILYLTKTDKKHKEGGKA